MSFLMSHFTSTSCIFHSTFILPPMPANIFAVVSRHVMKLNSRKSGFQRLFKLAMCFIWEAIRLILPWSNICKCFDSWGCPKGVWQWLLVLLPSSFRMTHVTKDHRPQLRHYLVIQTGFLLILIKWQRSIASSLKCSRSSKNKNSHLS